MNVIVNVTEKDNKEYGCCRADFSGDSWVTDIKEYINSVFNNRMNLNTVFEMKMYSSKTLTYDLSKYQLVTFCVTDNGILTLSTVSVTK